MTISSRISSRFSITLVLAASVALGASAVACSSSSSDSGEVPTNGGGDGGGSSNGDGGGTSSNLDGGAGNDSATQTGPVKSGFVMVSQSTFMSTTSHSAMAGFSTTHSSIGSSGTTCTVSTEGSCQVTTCTVEDAGTTADASVEAGASQDTIDSAGNVTISGGKLSSPIVLTPDSKNTYAVNSGTGQVFAGGDMVKVSAAGATVPAFESNVAAPGDITVTAPAFSSFATSFSKSSDLNITWTGGAAGDVNVSISSVGAKVVTISCKFAANGGSGTVPKAALNDIGSSGSIAISPSVVTSLKAGDYNVIYTLAGTGAAGSFTAN